MAQACAMTRDFPSVHAYFPFKLHFAVKSDATFLVIPQIEKACAMQKSNQNSSRDLQSSRRFVLDEY